MSADDKPVDEKLCNNCGKCCYKKIIIGRTVYITPFPCEYLDTATNLCSIYDRRHELNPNCLSVREGLKVSAFPEDCPYVPELAPKNYRPAREEWSWVDEWKTFDDLADDLSVSPETRQIVRARGPDAPPMYVEVNERVARERARQSAPVQPPLIQDGAPGGMKIVRDEPLAQEPAPVLADLLRQRKPSAGGSPAQDRRK
jgi:Fe-S-cluster containining protein